MKLRVLALAVMLLPGLAAILLMPLVLFWLYPPEIKNTPNAAQFAKEKLAEMGKMSHGERIMLTIFAVLLLLDAVAFVAVNALCEAKRAADRNEGNVVAGRMRRLSRIWMR